MFNRWFSTLWGQTNVLYLPVKRRYWVDLIILLAGCAILYSLVAVGELWTAPKRAAIIIDLSPSALPRYTLYSTMRALIAFAVSLGFTLVVAPIAAKNARAEKILIPFLDMCQSVPVLGFMPGLVIALAGLSRGHNIGLELAAILMIFTSQAWNMAFSVYYSIKSVPADLSEAGRHYGFSRWQRFKWLELPASMNGLVWNSMMSMAGAWFFLMINEAFTLGGQDYRLPGIGAYMSEAVVQGNRSAIAWALFAMLILIVLMDQLIWRPVLVWSLRFRIDDAVPGENETTWFLTLLRRSRLVRWLRRTLSRRKREVKRQIAQLPSAAVQSRWVTWLAWGLLICALGVIASMAAVRLTGLFMQVPVASWGNLFLRGGATLGRVLLATTLATLWTLPAGLAIGLSPRLSKLLQPVVQIVAAFPAPMLFTVTITLFIRYGLGINAGSVFLMLLGGQWYLLFNVIAGASAIPGDLREASAAYGLARWRRFTQLYLPCVFPYLVTGWVTCAGGSWNASIITEYFEQRGGGAISTFGLGSAITEAAAAANFPMLAASVLLMVIIVITFNRLVWRPLYQLAETKYALSK